VNPSHNPPRHTPSPGLGCPHTSTHPTAQSSPAPLLPSHHQVQYVALRNINLIVQRRPSILVNEVKVFFCKYNDPLYVKMEKLEVMIRLASEKNIDQVSAERGEEGRRARLRVKAAHVAVAWSARHCRGMGTKVQAILVLCEHMGLMLSRAWRPATPFPECRCCWS
jgi:hypothetical protein